MDTILNATGPILHYLSFIPIILWTLFLSLLEWVIPASWYAKDVSEDIVLITGAGSGLGRNIALEYAKLNSTLVLWDVDKKGLEETKTMIESEFDTQELVGKMRKSCYTCIVDVSDRIKIQDAAKQLYEDLNKERKEGEQEKYVSVLVNNAGIYHCLMLQDLTDEQIERIFKINILAHFWTVRAFLPKMIEHERGHIVEIASMAGYLSLAKQVDYGAVKHATVGFEEGLSMELFHMGLGNKIFTTSVCPFYFSSNLFTGYDSRAAGIMSSKYVAKEAVMAMRCNHSRVLLPKAYAYLCYVLKTYLPRRTCFQLAILLGFNAGIRNVKGRAAMN